MSVDKRGEGDEPEGEAQAGPAGAEHEAPPETEHKAGISSIDELRARVTDAAGEFLKTRLGLEEGPDGVLHLPERGVFENVGQRADQFLRGFLRGVIEKTPEEREVDAGLRDKADAPTSTEIVGRVLSKASEAVSTSFHRYLKDHVADPERHEPVVVDGRFLLRHGAPLLAGFVQALGSQFSSPAERAREQAAAPAPEPAPADEATPEPEPKPHVDYRVDLPSLFTSLFVRPRDNPDDEDQGGQR